MKKTELLAPCGNAEGLRAVINAGCDAVYLGGKDFSARAYAGNFNEKELIGAIEYAHRNGVRVHLALNTLLKNNEITGVKDSLVPFYEAGLDAVIIQDLGLINILRSEFPDLSVHASTQMSVTGPYGAMFLKEKGIDRIICARETSLEDIKNIKDNTGMEVEAFIHGSLCYSYSGKCLMSSIFGGRSGNRGRCAQPCRLAYDLYSGRMRINKDQEKYILSPKDLATVEILPEIIGTGVDSLKIEGRMKRPEYCAGVVSVYRKYIDMIEKKEEYRVDKKDLDLLKDLYNREGFTCGYFIKSPGIDLLSTKKVRIKGAAKDQNALYSDIKKNIIDKDKKTAITGKAVFREGVPSRLELSTGDIEISVEGSVPEKAKNAPVSGESIKDRILKTGNTPFEFKKLTVETDDDIFISIKDINELRRRGTDSLCAALEKRSARHYDPIDGSSLITGSSTFDDKENREDSRYGLKTDRFEIQTVVQNTDDAVSVSDIPDISTIIFDISCYRIEDLNDAIELFTALETDKKKIIMAPYIVKDPEVFKKCEYALSLGSTGVLINDLESLSYFSERYSKDMIFAGPYLYTMNDLSRRAVREKCAFDTVPYELNRREISGMDNSQSIIEVYGRIPLMITANVPMDPGMYKRNIFVKDRKGEMFPVRHSPLSSYNVIYNSRPLDLTGEADNVNSLNVHGIRLSFIEGEKDIKGICRRAADAFVRGKKTVPAGNYTKGHFNRGVE